VDQVAGDAKFEMKQTGQDITYSASGEEIRIFGDRKLLVSTIENVLRNSLRYAQPGPIDIDLSAHGDMAGPKHKRLRAGNAFLRTR
jgi:signal transduction histidine kinase